MAGGSTKGENYKLLAGDGLVEVCKSVAVVRTCKKSSQSMQRLLLRTGIKCEVGGVLLAHGDC